MPKIRFLEDVKTRNDVPWRFAAGQVVDLPEASANHWLSRNKAEVVDDDDPAAPARVVKPLATGGQAPGTARDGLPDGDPAARMGAAADATPPAPPPGPPLSPDGVIPPAADPQPKKPDAPKPRGR